VVVDLTSVEAEVLALGDALRRRGWRIASAESCTGGLIGAACTSVAGSSDWFECGWISYSNAAKTALLGVDPALIAAHGAVSEPVARAMAAGALARAGADLALAVTGIAGPGGGTPGKPVGLVWLALARRTGPAPPPVLTERLLLDGDRAAVRAGSVRRALALLRQAAA
jgi:nicotinamide-nucleotide amidase